jgi:hypothetical protein
MPNHRHLILTPGSSSSLEKAIQLSKGGSFFEIHKVRGRKMGIWQSGFHESRETSWADDQKKRDYVQFHSVAAKLVERPELWAYGSASGKFVVDPIPPGLKLVGSSSGDARAKTPTPGALTKGKSL